MQDCYAVAWLSGVLAAFVGRVARSYSGVEPLRALETGRRLRDEQQGQGCILGVYCLASFEPDCHAWLHGGGTCTSKTGSVCDTVTEVGIRTPCTAELELREKVKSQLWLWRGRLQERCGSEPLTHHTRHAPKLSCLDSRRYAESALLFLPFVPMRVQKFKQKTSEAADGGDI